MGPGGILEVSGRAEGSLLPPLGIEVGTPSLLIPAHGAAVDLVGGTAWVPAPDLAQGACVLTPGIGRAPATEGGPESGATGRA
jgi:hypothetical protein